MRSIPALIGFGLLAVALVGCGPSAGSAAPGGNALALPAPANTAAWKQVDNLEYLNWKKFPVGTRVVRTSTTTGGDGSVTSVETFTLRAKGESDLTVERQNTTTRSDGSYHKVNPPDERKIAAKIPVHPELDPTDFLKPDRKAEEVGKEKVTVLGKEYECVRWEWSNGTEAGPMTVVSWLSDDVPGRIVKQEMKVAAIKSTTIDQVTELKQPK